MNKKLVLASQSPRRKELLAQLGYQFVCHPADIDESVNASEDALTYVRRMAEEKATGTAMLLGQLTDHVILGSDTCVVINGKILAKPADLNDCIAILSLLSGQKHQVLTAIALSSKGRVISEVVCTDVYFKPLTKNEIVAYWQTGEPQDKAGAYGIQGIAGQFVRRIEGSYSAVVGLPLFETAQLLAKFDVYSSINSIETFK
ncbi:MAG: Maf-like protein [Colwellia sp.]|nr:Maf-like protein [Colwellia sp.]